MKRSIKKSQQEDLAIVLNELGHRANQSNLPLTAHLIFVAAESIRCGYGKENLIGALHEPQS